VLLLLSQASHTTKGEGKGRIKNGEKEKKGKKKKDRKKANGVTEFPPLLTIKQPSAVVIAAKFHSIIPPFFPFVQSSRVKSSQTVYGQRKIPSRAVWSRLDCV
jgi:hypothetical protein